MLKSNHPILKSSECLFATPPFRQLKGLISARIAYPLAEKLEKRNISSKVAELRRYYHNSPEKRLLAAKSELVDTLLFSQHNVPYYKELFRKRSFDPEKVRKDIQYLQDIPYLDKDIIREQGERMLSRPLSQARHYVCKTGGSTGQSAVIYYDQIGADYASAVTLYAREMIGKTKYKPELHFACRFPGEENNSWPSREDFKCFAMNRSNIFFDRLDEKGLDDIWKVLCRRKPFLIHEHPSTIYALACHIEKKYGRVKVFDVFESSGELLQPYMREKIAKVFNCQVVDRYGLAELGVMAYEISGQQGGLELFESEGWPESRKKDDDHEIVFTGFRNRLMPLIRYATGDRGQVTRNDKGFVLKNVTGRIHDIVTVNGVLYPTHHIMDMLDHRVGNIQEFQIDLRSEQPIMRIVPEPSAIHSEILNKIESFWPKGFQVEFVKTDELVRVGRRAKFRHVVT